MKIIGKKVQSNLFCEKDLYAIGGRAPIIWKNEHESECPPFGIFKITGYDVNERGAPIIMGTQPDGIENSVYGFNLKGAVEENNYGCCRLDFPLVAATDSAVTGASQRLGPQSGSWYLINDKRGYISLGSDYNNLCLIDEFLALPDGLVRWAITLPPHSPIPPNTIAGVYYTKWQCISDETSVCSIEWMWAAYGWLGLQYINSQSELELTYMPDHQGMWDCLVPPDNPSDSTFPRNRGPWFITDSSCPYVTPTDPYNSCANPGTFETITSSVEIINIG